MSRVWCLCVPESLGQVLYGEDCPQLLLAALPPHHHLGPQPEVIAVIFILIDQ